MMTDEMRSPRKLPTGSIMSQFGASQKSRYSDYASLPPELENLMEQLSRLKFPITSKSDLVTKLGGYEAPIFIGEMSVVAGAAAMFFPAGLFPAATVENLAEKLADTFRQRASTPSVEPMMPDDAGQLVSRFASENAKMIQLAAQLVRWVVSQNSKAIDTDSDAFAARLVRENQRTFQEIGGAFAAIGTFRAKASEATRSRQAAEVEEVEEPAA